MICECGQEILIGDWPFCPHGRDGKGGLVPFKGYVNQHVAPPHRWTPGHKGVLIESREQERRVFKENRAELAGWYGSDMGRDPERG